MASFQAKIGWKMLRKREYKKYRSVSFLPDATQKIQKKIAKKFKNLKNTILASIQAKIGWKRMRKRENKKQKSSLRFVSTQRVIENSKNIAKKLKKLKNTVMYILFKPKQVGKRQEREKIKIIVPFRSFPTRN